MLTNRGLPRLKRDLTQTIGYGSIGEGRRLYVLAKFSCESTVCLHEARVDQISEVLLSEFLNLK